MQKAPANLRWYLRARSHIDRQVARRQELAGSLRLAEGLDKRLGRHQRDHRWDEEYTLQALPETFFVSNNSCILQPEVIEGPCCESQSTRSWTFQ